MSIEGWWLSIGIRDAFYLDMHLALPIGIVVLVAVIKRFRRSRNVVKLDNSLALLGAVYPKQPGKKEHGPAFYKRRGKRL